MPPRPLGSTTPSAVTVDGPKHGCRTPDDAWIVHDLVMVWMEAPVVLTRELLCSLVVWRELRSGASIFP